MEKFGKFMALMVLLVMHYFVMGMVTMYLWEWFVSPVLNITTLNLVQAVGIVITSGFLFHKYSEKEKEVSFSDIITKLTKSYVASVIILTLGYLVQLFL